MSRSKGLKSKIRKIRDSYPTPKWCIHLLADALYDIIDNNAMTTNTYLCDIGAGDGRIGNICRKKLHPRMDVSCLLIDIEPLKKPVKHCLFISKDFMKVNLNKIFRNNKMCTIFVSNPPFSLADKIVFKTIEYLNSSAHLGIAAFLLRVNWLGSLKRTAWLQKNPPNKLLVLTPRPSFTGKGTDASEYAWFLWSNNIELGNAIDIVTKK